MPLPGIVIVGAQKAGTTSVHHALCHHPDVVAAVDPRTGAAVKELHFFSNDDRWQRGVAWYESHFPPQGIGIEATPNYLSTPIAHARMSRVLPSGRLVVLVRDPIARAHSQFNHYAQERPGSEAYDWALPGGSFAANVDAELCGAFAGTPYRGFLARGHYAAQLEHLAAVVPLDRTHVVIFERLIQDPARGLTRLTEALGLRAGSVALEALHKRSYADPELPPRLRARLSEHFGSHNDRLRALLGDPIPEWI